MYERLNIKTITDELRVKSEKKDGRFLIGIDGRCAAGKTSLAGRLQLETDCRVFHMDDFFLRPKQRTAKRLDEPGGNVDYERFLDEVLEPLKRGDNEIFYRRYDCQRGEILDAVKIIPGKINIIEGSYSLNRHLYDYYDYRIFLTITPEEQVSRILKRNGTERYKDFRDKWIPLEEEYFLDLKIRHEKIADIEGILQIDEL